MNFLLQAANNITLQSSDFLTSIPDIVGKLGITGLLAFAIWYLDKRHKTIEKMRDDERIRHDKEIKELRYNFDKKYDEISRRYDQEIKEIDTKYDTKMDALTLDLIVLNKKQTETIEKNNGALKSLETSIEKLIVKLG